MYFSGNNVSISLLTDQDETIELDASFFQFQVSRSNLPIYGYKSAFFDVVAKGEELVQGQFILNFDEVYKLNTYASIAPTQTHARGLLIEYNDPNSDIPIMYEGMVVEDLPRPQYYHILDIYIQSLGQSLNPSGEPIGESYTFIAQTLEPPKRVPTLLPIDIVEEDLGVPTDIALTPLEPSNYELWKPLLPESSICTIQYRHIVYPIAVSDITSDVALAGSGDYFSYRYYNDPEIVARSDDVLECIPATSALNLPDYAPPIAQDKSITLTFKGEADMLTTKTAYGVNADPNSITESYVPKDYVHLTPSELRDKYTKIIIDKTTTDLALHAGLHVISIMAIAFPVHTLPKPPASSEIEWNWQTEGVVVDVGDGEYGPITDGYFSNGNDHSLFFVSGLDLRNLDEVYMQATLQNFLLSNNANWPLNSDIWDPSPDPPWTDPQA